MSQNKHEIKYLIILQIDLTQQARDIRKAFGQFSSSKTQVCNTLKPIEIEFDAQEDVLEATQSVDFDKGDIIIKKSGIYLVIAGPQIAKLRGARNRWIDFWLRVNNVDLPNSNVRRVLTDSQEKDVIPMNAVCPLNRGDTLNIMMAAETEGEGIGIEALQPDGEPTIPSIILTLVQLDQDVVLIVFQFIKEKTNTQKFAY